MGRQLEHARHRNDRGLNSRMPLPAPAAPWKASLLLYRTRNLGDMIQTLALSRLLPQCDGIFRHRLGALAADSFLIVNGMLDKDRPPSRNGHSLFAGVSGPHFRAGQYLRWLAESPYPVGARDPATLQTLSAAGIPAALIGCATLTLPRYTGPRSGVYSVDATAAGPASAERRSQAITRHFTVEQQWAAALGALETFRTAEAVYTSRLHVALPCLAFGTPVWIASPSQSAWHPSRFGLLEAMGIEYERLVTAGVSPWAGRYVEFLETHLNRRIEPGEPKMPVSAYRPSRWTPEWWRW
jgi:hypothetical protein